MSFASPLYLIGLALIPVAARPLRALRAAPAGVRAREPACPRSRPGAPAGGATPRSSATASALAALLVALAKPQATIAVPTEQARVMIVTDRSGSMLAADVVAEPARGGQEGRRHVPRRDPGQGQASAPSPSTRRPRCCSRRPATTTPCARRCKSVKAAGSTATGDAITAALESLKGKAPAAIVLLSDGKSVRGSDPLTAAQTAKERKIPIYTVALGTANGHDQRRQSRSRPTRRRSRRSRSSPAARPSPPATSSRSTRSTSAWAPRSRPRSASSRSRTSSPAARSR